MKRAHVYQGYVSIPKSLIADVYAYKTCLYKLKGILEFVCYSIPVNYSVDFS